MPILEIHAQTLTCVRDQVQSQGVKIHTGKFPN